MNHNSLPHLPPCVQGYWDFPYTIDAFGRSLKGSFLSVVDGVFSRVRGSTVKVITWFCSVDTLLSYVKRVSGLGKSVSFLNQTPAFGKVLDGLNTRFYGNEFCVKSGWCPRTASLAVGGEHGRKLRKSIEVCPSTYRIGDTTPDQRLDLLYRWAQQAKDRHFMVVTGHYRAYVELDELPPGVQILGFFRDDVLWGMFGFELFQGMAQVTVAKHITGDNKFPLYMWATGVETALSSGASMVFCGSTADDLKLHLGMSFEKSYKVIL